MNIPDFNAEALRLYVKHNRMLPLAVVKSVLERGAEMALEMTIAEIHLEKLHREKMNRDGFYDQ